MNASVSKLPEVLNTVGSHHIEITFAHPDLAGWMRAHEANADIANGGR